MTEICAEPLSVVGILGECLGNYDFMYRSLIQKTSVALQGAFVEHRTALERLPFRKKLEVILVKTPEDLERCDALIIPGGGAFHPVLDDP